MHFRVKADWLEDETKRMSYIYLSKNGKIEELRELIKEEIGLEPRQQRLFYKGKELIDGHRLIDYNFVQNDVVIATVRHILEPENESESSNTVEPEVEPLESDTIDENKESLVDAESKYYKVGDLVDVRLLDTGAWFEGRIDKIFKKEGEEGTEENQLIFRVSSEEHVSVVGFDEDATFKNIRPRSHHVYKFSGEFSPGMTVLANLNIDQPKQRGYWYDFEITDIHRTSMVGTIYWSSGKLNNCKIKFVHECMRIEEPKILTEQKDEPIKVVNRIYPFYCNDCKDDRNKLCKECSCKVCGGKEQWDKIIICDECDREYHVFCLDPPLDDIPEDDWFCADCKTDDSEIVKPGEKVKFSKKRQNMPNNVTKSKKDWGRGMACAGLTKKNDKIAVSHVGPVPGVEVGFTWKFRQGASEAGVHRPPISGIHGQENDCAYSIVLGGGYEDDKDYGKEFIYTGAGGRDLSGNKRTNTQSFDQTLTRCNRALALNCNAKLDDTNGAEATDWKAGRPVRVLRSCKFRKHSKYAPKSGYRYDGLYKVVKYYPEKGKSGFLVWKYLLRRDDPAPAPWEKNAKTYDTVYPEGYLEVQAARKSKELENKKSSTSKKGKKRKTDSADVMEMLNKKKKSDEFILDKDLLEAINKDTVNKKLWSRCLEAAKEGKMPFLDKVEETFKCIICIELIFDPVMLKCGHHYCKNCLKRSVQHCTTEAYKCPHCRELSDKKDTLTTDYQNKALQVVLNLLFPGYGQD